MQAIEPLSKAVLEALDARASEDAERLLAQATTEAMEDGHSPESMAKVEAFLDLAPPTPSPDPAASPDVQLRIKRVIGVLRHLPGLTPDEDSLRAISGMNRAERRAMIAQANSRRRKRRKK